MRFIFLSVAVIVFLVPNLVIGQQESAAKDHSQDEQGLKRLAKNLLGDGKVYFETIPSWSQVRKTFKKQQDAAAVYSDCLDMFLGAPDNGMKFPEEIDQVAVKKYGATANNETRFGVFVPTAFVDVADRFNKNVPLYAVEFASSSGSATRTLHTFANVDNKWFLMNRPWKALTQDVPADLGSTFIKMLANNRLKDGYQFCSNRLRQQITFEEFKKLIKALHLDDVVRVNWDSKTTETNDHGEELVLRDGKLIYESGVQSWIRLRLIKEDTDLNVLSIKVTNVVGID